MTNSVESQLAIQVTKVGPKSTQTTDARGLHAKLEVKKKFTDWVKYQIERFELVEGRDYAVFNDLSFPNLGSSNPENEAKTESQMSKGRAQKTTEYQFTADIAKLIAASSNTKQGNRIREYLVAVETDYSQMKLAQAVAQVKLEYSAEASAIRGTSPTYDIGRKLIQSSKKMKAGKPWPPEVLTVISMARKQAAELQRLLETFDPDNVVDYEDDHVYAKIEFELKNSDRLGIARATVPFLKH